MIYFDNAATTKANKEILALFSTIESENFGNPSSIHGLGLKALTYLEAARKMILKSLKLKDFKVIFTSSSTEANNLGIIGYCLKHRNRGNHIITSKIEHPSVLETIKVLCEKYGFSATYLDVNKEGMIDINDLKNSIKQETILVSLMAVNNETGSINDIVSIATLLKNYPKICFHCDTTQAIGKIPLDYSLLDMFVISGHKIHGFKNSGCLICKESISIDPIIFGGGQEFSLRSGTTSVSSACTLAKAVELSAQNIETKYAHTLSLQSKLRNLLNNENYLINTPINSSPYIFSISFANKKSSVIVEALSNKEIYVSSVSACHSKTEKMSYVVYEMFRDENRARNTLRVSFNENNTVDEIDTFVTTLEQIVRTVQ